MTKTDMLAFLAGELLAIDATIDETCRAFAQLARDMALRGLSALLAERHRIIVTRGQIIRGPESSDDYRQAMAVVNGLLRSR